MLLPNIWSGTHPLVSSFRPIRNWQRVESSAASALAVAWKRISSISIAVRCGFWRKVKSGIRTLALSAPKFGVVAAKMIGVGVDNVLANSWAGLSSAAQGSMIWGI